MNARKVRARFRRRRGLAMVETAVVLTLLTTLVFGFFEYSRLLMDMNLLNNAAREAGRFAQVNNTKSTLSADVQTLVNGYLGSEAASFSGLTVTLSGAHSGVTTPIANLVPGDKITVGVSGTYKFLQIIPLFKMPTNLTLSSSVTVGCEGGS